MNPLGTLPLFISILKPIDPKRHTLIILREIFLAYLMIIIFMFFGQVFLRSIQITSQALEISGGLILFIIAIRMIFPTEDRSPAKPSSQEPLFVPIAMPMTAGPGTLTTVMLLSSSHPEKRLSWLIAITAASAVIASIMLSGRYLNKYLGEKGLIALERLSGMMLTAMAVQMFLSGVNDYFRIY